MSAEPQHVLIEEVGAETDSVVHQALRREVNERIRKLGVGFEDSPPDAIVVVCECAYGDCTGRVRIAIADYEAVRRFPTRFLVKAGHEVSEFERVVAECNACPVVEKVGRGGFYALGADPRRRLTRSAGEPL